MSKALVAVLMGSDSDRSTMEAAPNILEDFGIPYEVRVISAHRTPDVLREYVGGLESKGVELVIAGAGKAAHLAGAVAALTTLPVIGVPLYSKEFGGLDALMSTVQMPSGIPVATVAIDGAKNAALLAVAIMAIRDSRLKERLAQFRRKLAETGSKK